MTDFFKKSKKSYFGVIFGTFCPNLGKKIFSWKKGLCQFLDIPILYHCAKNQKKTTEPFLRKTPNWWTDGQTDNGDFIGPSIGRDPKIAQQYQKVCKRQNHLLVPVGQSFLKLKLQGAHFKDHIIPDQKLPQFRHFCGEYFG